MAEVKVCGRCKGEGYIKHYGHVVAGLCFKCYGVGTNDKVAIAQAQGRYTQEQTAKVKVTEEESKAVSLYLLADAYKTVNDPTASERRKKSARDYAKTVWEDCKKAGYTFTLEEIKAQAESNALPF